MIGLRQLSTTTNGFVIEATSSKKKHVEKGEHLRAEGREL